MPRFDDIEIQRIIREAKGQKREEEEAKKNQEFRERQRKVYKVLTLMVEPIIEEFCKAVGISLQQHGGIKRGQWTQKHKGYAGEWTVDTYNYQALAVSMVANDQGNITHFSVYGIPNLNRDNFKVRTNDLSEQSLVEKLTEIASKYF